MKKLSLLAVLTCLWVGSLPVWGEVGWDTVKKKVTEGKSYSLEYKYDGPKGIFKFDYRTVVPGKIRSEIKDSKTDTSRVGIIAIYDTEWNKDKVRFYQGSQPIIRNTTHKDVEDTPFATPVFNLVMQQIGSAAPTAVAEGDRTRFEFKTGTGKYTVWANAAGDIVKTERIDGRDKAREVREFTQIQWNNNPACAK